MNDGDVKRITAMGGVLSTELLETIMKSLSGGPNIKAAQTVKKE